MCAGTPTVFVGCRKIDPVLGATVASVGVKPRKRVPHADGESNLDNFVNRYDSSQLGRFMMPDPLG